MSKSYEEKIEFERKFFNKEIYDSERLIEKATDALQYVLDAFNEKISSQLGLGPWDYLASQINLMPKASILSVGTGPCGLELYIGQRLTNQYTIDCVDVNDKLLNMGMGKAAQQNVNLVPIIQDANKLKLQKQYDFVIAHASLHHLVKLEHAFTEIHEHLTPNGKFYVYEATPRNGMLLWPEQKILINEIFKVLPERLRRDQASGDKTVLRTEFPERDVSEGGFECVRSQEIISLLEEMFVAEYRFHGNAFARRFVDSEFGRNYDLRKELDKTILDMLIKFDHFLVSRGHLKPEGIFYILRRRK